MLNEQQELNLHKNTNFRKLQFLIFNFFDLKSNISETILFHIHIYRSQNVNYASTHSSRFLFNGYENSVRPTDQFGSFLSYVLSIICGQGESLFLLFVM